MYLEGVNIKPYNTKDARALVGKHVQYVRESDIDKSGRGYFFTNSGTIKEVSNRQMCIDGSWLCISEIREMVETSRHEDPKEGNYCA